MLTQRQRARRLQSLTSNYSKTRKMRYSLRPYSESSVRPTADQKLANSIEQYALYSILVRGQFSCLGCSHFDHLHRSIVASDSEDGAAGVEIQAVRWVGSEVYGGHTSHTAHVPHFHHSVSVTRRNGVTLITIMIITLFKFNRFSWAQWLY